MNGEPEETLENLLRNRNPDLPRVIDLFIRRFNAAHGNPASDRWDIRKEDWQRYEFLGDRVLNLVVARILFSRGDCVLDEGEMTKILSSVVSNQSLSLLADRKDPAGFSRLIPVSIGEQHTYGERITGGAFEAFIGALSCEAGLEDISCFIAGIMAEPLERYDPLTNAIGRLQEYYQKKAMGIPEYRVVDRIGPDHRPTFTVQVTAPDERCAEGSGPRLPDARQAAARALLRSLGDVNC